MLTEFTPVDEVITLEFMPTDRCDQCGCEYHGRDIINAAGTPVGFVCVDCDRLPE